MRAVGEEGGRRRRGFWLSSATAICGLYHFVLPRKEDLAQFPRWLVRDVFEKVERQRQWDGERQEVILGHEEKRREERKNLHLTSFLKATCLFNKNMERQEER